jgi:hypothetical protein
MYREDYIYLAILWRKPEDREAFLAINNIHDVNWDEVAYPKIYRADLAKYALFHGDVLQGLYDTREAAWDAAEGLEGFVYVADVPNTEKENPQYHKYYSERKCLCDGCTEEEASIVFTEKNNTEELTAEDLGSH